MTLRTFTVFLWVCLIATAAIAGEEHRTDNKDGVTVISGNEIDADTRAKIEEVLKEAGENSDVMFIDGSELHDDMQAHENREVRIIKKETNVTN